MKASDLALLDEVKSAFKDRKMPEGRLIRGDVDLSFHQEAMRVDAYMRLNRKIIDRHNSSLVAFNYLIPLASLWILPSYIDFIIRNFEDDDFIIASTIGAIASGMPDGSYQAQQNLGIEMRGLANDKEVKAVGDFCRWIQENTAEIGIDSLIADAIELWS